MPVTVLLCCNDPDNGNYLGYVESMEIGDITLEGPRVLIGYIQKKMSSAQAYEGEHTLRVGRLQIPALGYKEWFGNWCWDAVKVRGIHALRLLNFMAAKPNWQCVEAPEEIFKAFKDRRVVTLEEWMRATA